MGTDETSSLKNIFKNAAAIDLQNKEVSALMGKNDDIENNVLPGGIISKYGRVEAKEVKSKKKKQEKAFIAWLLRQSIKNLHKVIQEIIDFHQEQMDWFEQQIREAHEHIDHLSEIHEVLKDEMEKFQEHGAFELDEYRHFKNPLAEKAIQDWETKTGKTIDLTDPHSYEDVLDILEGIEAQEHAIKAEKEQHQKNYEYHKDKRDEARKIQDYLNSDNPALQKRGRELLNDFDAFQKNNVTKNLKSEIKNPRTETQAFSTYEVTAEDLEYDDFAFDFPPMNAEFNQSAHEDTNEKQPEVPEVNPKSPVIKPKF